MEKKEFMIERIDFIGIRENMETQEKEMVPLSVLYNTNVISKEEVSNILEQGENLFQDTRIIVIPTINACALMDMPVPKQLQAKEERPDIIIGPNGAEFVN